MPEAITFLPILKFRSQTSQEIASRKNEKNERTHRWPEFCVRTQQGEREREQEAQVTSNIPSHQDLTGDMLKFCLVWPMQNHLFSILKVTDCHLKTQNDEKKICQYLNH